MAEARPFATSPSRPHYTKTTRIAADLPRCGRAGRLSFRCSREDSNPLALGSVGSRSSHLSCERMWCRHPLGQEGGVRGMRLEELGPRSLLEMPDGPHGRLEAIAPTVSLLAAQGQPDEIRFRIRLGRHLQGVLRTRHGTVIGITEPLIATGKAFGETWQGDVRVNVDVAPVGLDLEAAALVRWADGGEMLRGHERRFGWSAQPERNPVDPRGSSRCG